MKPKTIFDKHVVNELAPRLKALSHKEGVSLYKELHPAIGRLYKDGTIHCSCCNHEFKEKNPEKKVQKCPKCHLVLTKNTERFRNIDAYRYYGRFEVLDDTIVMRIWEIAMRIRIKGESRWYIHEVERYFYEGKKHAIMARLEAGFMYNRSGRYSQYSQLELRNPYGRGHWMLENLSKVDFPSVEIPKPYAMRGLKDWSVLRTYHYDEVLNHIFIPSYETMFKKGLYSLALALGYSFMTSHWDSIRIALKHNPAILHAPFWKDTIMMMSRLKMDVRNPQLIATDRYREIHDTLVERERRKREEQRRRDQIAYQIRQREQEKEWEEKYVALKKKYFDLSFRGENDIVIQPLKSVAEFREEGDRQHICVYTAGYYKHENSLILSARIGDEIIETIEVNLDRYTIVQCRAKHNGVTQYHDYIKNLVNQNMNQIRAIA